MDLIYGELSYAVRGCIFDVHNALGPGFDEDAYHQALAIRLQNGAIPFRSKPRRMLQHRGMSVHEFEADFIIDEKIILELKSIASDFLPSHYVQIITYLKLWQKRLGLLINFGMPKANIERIPFTEKLKDSLENYDHIRDRMQGATRQHFEAVREAIFSVFEIHGLGYGSSVYLNMIKAELSYRKINFVPETGIGLKFDEKHVGVYELKYPVIENEIICGVTALQDRIAQYDIARMQTYLRVLHKDIGVFANFGKKSLEIFGIHA